MSGKKKSGRKTGAGGPEGSYVLRLYITGVTTRSTRALQNLKAVCEEYLEGGYSLEVIDIYQQPDRLKADQIIAAPTLIKSLPVPVKKILGDLSDREKLLHALDLNPTEKSPT